MQLNASDHRIYQHLNLPLRLMGFTMDEIFTMGLFIFLLTKADSLWTSIAYFLSMGVSVYGLKKGKKFWSGFSVTSFIHWHLGWIRNPSSAWPRSHNRFWLS
jgi:hypothetical protein